LGIEEPQSMILMVGAFSESKVAPRCKKKKRDYKVISLLLKLAFH
jgi:hypothetical protein